MPGRKIYLVHLNIYQEQKLGGSSLQKWIQTFANQGFKTKIKKIEFGKILRGTSKITTWNMQGACKADTAKTFLSS